ncbi:major facilitator superfamily domain-containing 10 [Brachionus plicatilis]|uniref:Major facilitator superfamily domain-containing 10 n=1 Tax=Brachionus plicatilis TaxID=10195 RepID=A0A3M7SX36_BRAPC|nr:major facilitator superfamily domain-containing 10 [Brachionus plicatilis]
MEQKYVAFVSLFLDLFAFTLILPLFPKIFDFYASKKDDLTYNFLENSVDEYRKLIAASTDRSLNSVLFGGLIGSLFSFLQFVSSTLIGAASDLYGRKPVLLLAMTGTLISYILWSVSGYFVIFLLSRIVGGISKANVSIIIAIMTDLTKKENRSQAMALVGIAFSLGFIIGPTFGAIFSSKLSATASIYTYPSYLAIGLTIINIIFVTLFYKESLPAEKRSKSIKNIFYQSVQFINPISLFNFSPIKSLNEQDLNDLKNIGFSNFLYLFIYSGLEFTLTFLVHHRFSYNSVQQGKMFLFIGILMTLIQGGYVRRIKPGRHLSASIKAIMILIPSFILVALASNQMVLYVGLTFYTYASAVVIPCFTTISSIYGNDDEKGTITGIFRSLGALARALGPTFTSMIYWTFGASFAYIVGSIAFLIPLSILIRTNSRLSQAAKKSD